MIEVRKSNERGHTKFDWLDSRHSFSFGNYYDKKHMGFGDIRVINDDVVAPGAGFPKHPHSDMEIVTYVLKGALEHGDSLGNGSVMRPGDVQRMTAGRGIAHSEFNASSTDPVHLLQIWILPEQRGLTPGYEQKTFDDLDGKLRVVASRDGRDGSVTIHQDMTVHAGKLAAGQSAEISLDEGRLAWVQVASGKIALGGQVLEAGDAAALTEEPSFRISADADAEVLVFDTN